jgi:ethanolamine permease
LPGRKTPHYAIIVGTVLSYALALVIHLAPGNGSVAITLINMSVFSALVSYLFTMTSYIVLARDHPDMSRPFASPFGVTGAMTALLIALAAVLLLFANPEFRSGLYATAVLLVAGIVYFVARRRHRLIAAPEETFALALKDREKAAPPAAAASLPAGAE